MTTPTTALLTEDIERRMAVIADEYEDCGAGRRKQHMEWAFDVIRSLLAERGAHQPPQKGRCDSVLTAEEIDGMERNRLLILCDIERGHNAVGSAADFLEFQVASLIASHRSLSAQVAGENGRNRP